MTIGGMREQVLLQLPVATIDEIGSAYYTYSTVDQLWARVRPVSAAERFKAGRNASEGVFEVTIRWRVGISPQLRLAWRGRVLSIDQVLNLDERRKYLTLMCTDVEPAAGTATASIAINPSPILDTISAQTLISLALRKTTASPFSGSFILVRRSSDNALLAVGFAADGWLDVDALLGFCGSASAYVQIWYNGISGLSAQQLTPSAQPQIVNAGVMNTSGGRPALVFSGAQYMTIASPGITFGSTMAVNAVAAQSASDRLQTIVAQRGSTAAARVFGLADWGNSGLLWGVNNFIGPNLFSPTDLSGWGRNPDVSVVADGQLAGSQAWKITTSQTIGFQSISLAPPAWMGGVTYVYSIVVDNSSARYVQFLLNVSVTTSYVNFDLQAGTFNLYDNGQSSSATITSLGSGTWRLTFAFTTTAAVAIYQSAYLKIAQSLTDTRAASYAGNGTTYIRASQPILAIGAANADITNASALTPTVTRPFINSVLTGVHTGSQIVASRNGITGTAIAKTGAITTALTEPITIGCEMVNGSPTNFFKGSISEINILASLPTAAQTALEQNQIGNFGIIG